MCSKTFTKLSLYVFRIHVNDKIIVHVFANLTLDR